MPDGTDHAGAAPAARRHGATPQCLRGLDPGAHQVAHRQGAVHRERVREPRPAGGEGVRQDPPGRGDGRTRRQAQALLHHNRTGAACPERVAAGDRRAERGAGVEGGVSMRKAPGTFRGRGPSFSLRARIAREFAALQGANERRLIERRETLKHKLIALEYLTMGRLHQSHTTLVGGSPPRHYLPRRSP
jgi:hypothetical protein